MFSMFPASRHGPLSTEYYVRSSITKIMRAVHTALQLLRSSLLTVFGHRLTTEAAGEPYPAPERWEVRYLSWFDIQGNSSCLETGWRPHSESEENPQAGSRSPHSGASLDHEAISLGGQRGAVSLLLSSQFKS